jgi:hypothetical protein
MSHYQTARRNILVEQQSAGLPPSDSATGWKKRKEKERKGNTRMIKRMITGNEIKITCQDVRTGDIWSDVIASVFLEVSKKRNASIFNGSRI